MTLSRAIMLVLLATSSASAAQDEEGTSAEEPASLDPQAAERTKKSTKKSTKKGAKSAKGSKASKQDTAAKPASSGPDARPAPRPSATEHSRQPSPVVARPTPAEASPSGAPPSNTVVQGHPVRAPSASVTAANRHSLAPAKPVPTSFVPFDATRERAAPWRSPDHRIARPNWRYVRPHPHAAAPPPASMAYRPWYSHWWVHPYWRHIHACAVVVSFPFVVHAWTPHWVPPTRAGWFWVPGYWAWGYWSPGYWSPVPSPPVRYVYVPGWWQASTYVEGYWRLRERDSGDWIWVDGHYLVDGTYVPGHWRPAGYGPEGYVWEPGFFDGEAWVDGFWRPEHYAGYVWVSAWFDDQGLHHAGYWEPIEEVPGQVWIPGWFDGTQWVQGYWVNAEDYEAADPESWQPEAGWDEGWDKPPPADEPAPLALPVQ